jgi:cysteine protease ATG4
VCTSHDPGLDMSNPQPSPAPTTTTSTPKVSKFLRPEWRDRQRSSTTDGATMSTSETPSRASRILGKKGSKLFSRSRDDDIVSSPLANETHSTSAPIPISDPPVIIEPPSNSKPRPRPPRPSTAGDNSGLNINTTASSSGALSGSSSARNIGDLGSRLSGWFNHTFSGSSTDLSLPTILAQSNISPTQMLAGSPRTKTSHPLLTAARQGKDHLDKAMRYLLDSDAQPDKSTDKIWVLGVEHPGYEPPPPPSSTPQSLVSSPPSSALVPPQKKTHRRDSTSSRNKSPSSYRSPIPVSHSNSSTQSLSSAVSSSSTVNASAAAAKQANLWPPDFYADFTTRVWLTYRNTFPPIRDTSLSSLEPVCGSSNQSSSSHDAPLPSPSKPRWPWSGEKGWTSDAGWGCMLRTGQSLLANSLIHLHLGRGWRRPNQPSLTPDFAQYVRILTWFLDTPSPLAPFGVHRMALAGKELGKEVGSWFGPSTAAGAIKRLVSEFEEAGLEVVLAVDSVVYQSEVYAASNGQKSAPNKPKHGKKGQPQKWGNRAVLVLVNLRLGIDGVHPIYYDSVKVC